MSLTDPATQLAAAFSVGNMLSYIARASRTRRARSSSRFGINWTTSPICSPRREIRRKYSANDRQHQLTVGLGLPRWKTYAHHK